MPYFNFGEEFSSPDAYFIAGGRTLEIIKKFEDDLENRKGLQDAIARDYNALDFFMGPQFLSRFTLDHMTSDPALTLIRDNEGKTKTYTYGPNPETPEGRALESRIEDTPDIFGDNAIFAKRLTGSVNTPINPDKVRYMGEERYGNRDGWISASYAKYGDVYVVAVPRTIRATFNEASEKATEERKLDGIKIAAGYRYEWFTPPDSQPIPYSKVIELEEKEKGDQTKPRQVNTGATAFDPEVISFNPPSNRP